MRRAAPPILLWLLLLAAPAAAAEELAAASGRIVADAYGGRVAWAQRDAGGDRWRLVEHRDGKVRRLPVEAFPAPVRIDLGPGPDGGVVAVYARDGKLALYDFAAGEERMLVEFGEGSLPSVWRGELVFARRAGGVSTLWRGRFGTGRLRKLPGGPQQGVSGPLATEVRGSRVVYVWSHRDDDGLAETSLFEVRGERAVLRDRTGSGRRSSSTFVTPEIHGSRAYYGRAVVGAAGQQLRRVSLKDGRVEAVRVPYGPLVTAVRESADRFLLSRVEGEEEPGPAECGMDDETPLSASICRLLRSDPISGWASIRTRVAH